MKARILRTSILALVVAAILFVTLEPLSGPPRPPDLCLYCGLRALADGVLNVLLFVPLGAALAWRFGGSWRHVLLAAGLSLLVEVVQAGIPGRDPSLSDLVSNTLGAALGVILVRHAALALALFQRYPRTWAATALALTVAGLAVAALLLRPQWPDGSWWVRWGTSTEVEAVFHGQTRDARLGSVPLWPGGLNWGQTSAARRALEAGLPLTATAVLPARPERGVAGVVGIAAGPVEVAMLGVAGRAAVYRFRTRAARWGLDEPDLRLENAFGGNTWPREVRLAAWRDGERYCLAAGGRSDCTLGFTLGDTRSLLLSIGEGPIWWRRFLNALWLALLFLPAGLFPRRAPDRLVLGVVVVAVLVLLPRFTGLATTPGEQYLAALAGTLAGGAWISGRARRRRTPTPARPRSDRSARNSR